VVWLTSTSTIPFLGLRAYARWTTFYTLFWDDLLVFLTWLTFAAFAAVATIYRNAYSSAGILQWQESRAVEYQQYRDGLVAILLFLTSIWLVKFAFLVFF
jgi:hypothetical protein